MQAPLRFTLPAAIAAIALTASCGEEPVLVTETEASHAGGGLGSPDGSGSPHGTGQITGLSFSGRIELTGGLASVEQGHVFVNLRRGAELPYLSRKYSFPGGEVQKTDGGWVIDFTLDQSNQMAPVIPAPLPADLLLQAYFDADGYVDTKDDRVEGKQPVEPGASGILLTLDGELP